jgi:hypothetical protein
MRIRFSRNEGFVHGAVVKLEFTPVCHTGGRGFESRQLRHLQNKAAR